MSWYFENAGWLYTKIYQNEFFFFDLWSFMHCWSGFFIFLLIKLKKVKSPLAALLTILFVYEVLEILLTYFALNIFNPETIKDQFTDIFVGMFGGFIGFTMLKFIKLKNKFHLRNLNYFVIFLASITYSWLWVGFYQYDYNQEFYNSQGINVGAFFFWILGAFVTIWVSTRINISNIWLKWIVVWAIYLPCLFAIEYFGFVILSLHESSKPDAQPLLFGLIHGTPVLHFVYIFSPFFTISIYNGLKKLIFKALKVTKTGNINTIEEIVRTENLQKVTFQSNR
jgi:uncharacterized membrane protein YeaQ/YmgE (transglycosylase-associated protein family)